MAHNKKTTSISIDADLDKAAKAAAKKEHRSFSNFIEHLIKQYLKIE